MGGSKVETGGNTTTQATPTAEETELNKMELQRQRDINPYIVPMQQQAYTLGSQLLQGKQLPGYLGSLPQGVQSEQMDVGSTQLGEDYTADLVRQSLRDIFPQFQQMGLPVESGVAQSIAGRTAGDIRRNVAETNIERGMGARQFNIQTDQANQYQNLNNLFNLLNLAVGGQAQIQAPVMAGADTLGQRLAGLRTTQTNAQGVQKNPFTGVNLGIFGTWGR